MGHNEIRMRNFTTKLRFSRHFGIFIWNYIMCNLNHFINHDIDSCLFRIENPDHLEIICSISFLAYI